MTVIHENLKALVAALVAFVTALLPVLNDSTPPDAAQWGYAAGAALVALNVTWAATNRASFSAALKVVLPVLDKRVPGAANGLRGALSAVPEFVPAVVPVAPVPTYTGPIPPVTPAP